MTDVDEARTPVARRLDHLFKTVYPKQLGRPYSYREAAAAINKLAGQPVVTHTYLQQIRTGARKTPGAEKLRWIARLFGVPVESFYDPAVAERIDAQLAVAAELRDDLAVQEIAKLARGLSAEALEGIKAQLRYARRLEGLPDPGEPPQPTPK